MKAGDVLVCHVIPGYPYLVLGASAWKGLIDALDLTTGVVHRGYFSAVSFEEGREAWWRL